MEPWSGSLGGLNVISSSGSGSSPVRVMARATLTSVKRLWSSAVGAWFCTSIDTVATLLSAPLVSVTLNVKLSGPA
jgi:hypothetical protein